MRPRDHPETRPDHRRRHTHGTTEGHADMSERYRQREAAHDAAATGEPHTFVSDETVSGVHCLCRRLRANPIHHVSDAPTMTAAERYERAIRDAVPKLEAIADDIDHSYSTVDWSRLIGTWRRQRAVAIDLRRALDGDTGTSVSVDPDGAPRGCTDPAGVTRRDGSHVFSLNPRPNTWGTLIWRQPGQADETETVTLTVEFADGTTMTDTWER